MSFLAQTDLSRRALLLTVAAAGLPASAQGTPQRPMTVYKSPACGCCTAWIDHARKAGFAPEVVDIEDVGPVKARLGVPATLASCHTVVIGAHVFEGHVPIGDVQRFLTNPRGLGLAVPGMPLGSPGMETTNGQVDRFAVLAFDRQGRTSVFARYGA